MPTATSGKRTTTKRPANTGFRISASGARFGLFCFRYLRQTKGRWAGKPLGLEVWQIAGMSELLKVENEKWRTITSAEARQIERDPAAFWKKIDAWRRRSSTATSGLRIYREGLEGRPKKNGKSTESSALALYLLIGDGEPGAEVYSTASAKDQARIVFRQAKEMVERSPMILPHVRLYRDAIEVLEDGSFYKVLSADAGVQEGINPHGVINDELAAQKSRDLYDTLRTATIARDQPLLYSITTAGYDVIGTIGGELYRRGAGNKPRVRDGMVVPRKDKQSTFYFRWYQVDPRKADNIDEVLKANPASWITREKIEEESSVERPRAVFLRYHGNMWTRVELHWLRDGAWDRLRGKRGDKTCVPHRRHGEEEILPGEPVVITVDVGQYHDTAAVGEFRPARLGGKDDREDPIAMRVRVWGVHPDPKKPPPPAHIVEPGEGPLRLELLMNYILDIAKRQRVLCVAADPYKFETQLEELEDLGLMAIRFDQSNARMVPASEGLYKSIGNELVAHNGDEVLAIQIGNAVARDTGRGWRLDKQKATEPMDAAVVCAMGVALCGNEEILDGRPSATNL